jgi:hypothetical protein
MAATEGDTESDSDEDMPPQMQAFVAAADGDTESDSENDDYAAPPQPTAPPLPAPDRLNGAKVVTAADSTPAPAAGRRVKMSARPLLERLNFDEALVAHFGTDFMDTLKIDQMRDGSNDGMFVAHDALAVLTGMRIDNAVRKIKNMTKHSLQVGQRGVSEGLFPSSRIVQGSNQNVSFS